VSIPPRKEIEGKLLILLAQHGKIRPSQAISSLAKYFDLSLEERSARYERSDDNKWHKEVRFARQGLISQGLISKEEYGIWQLTTLGQSKYQALVNPPRIFLSEDSLSTDKNQETIEIQERTIDANSDLDSIRNSLNEISKRVTNTELASNEVEKIVNNIDSLTQAVQELYRLFDNLNQSLLNQKVQIKLSEEKGQKNESINLSRDQTNYTKFGVFISIIALLVAFLPFLFQFFG
jgi:plasmid maintenance system antidote protein VapI